MREVVGGVVARVIFGACVGSLLKGGEREQRKRIFFVFCVFVYFWWGCVTHLMTGEHLLRRKVCKWYSPHF